MSVRLTVCHVCCLLRGFRVRLFSREVMLCREGSLPTLVPPSKYSQAYPKAGQPLSSMRNYRGTSLETIPSNRELPMYAPLAPPQSHLWTCLDCCSVGPLASGTFMMS